MGIPDLQGKKKIAFLKEEEEEACNGKVKWYEGQNVYKWRTMKNNRFAGNNQGK
jgi:hypothetical protein